MAIWINNGNECCAFRDFDLSAMEQFPYLEIGQRLTQV